MFRLNDISRKIAFEIGKVLAFLKTIIERNIIYKCSDAIYMQYIYIYILMRYVHIDSMEICI